MPRAGLAGGAVVFTAVSAFCPNGNGKYLHGRKYKIAPATTVASTVSKALTLALLPNKGMRIFLTSLPLAAALGACEKSNSGSGSNSSVGSCGTCAFSGFACSL